MKFLNFIFLLLFCTLSAQKKLPFDSLKIAETKDFFVDDYGNFYLYKNQDFSLTKTDSLGKQQGRMMLTMPYKIQNVQNPLNIVLFSENAQQIKFVDQNLNAIQNIDLRKFGFIKMAYAEDLQQIWFLDDSMKRIVQYNFRDDRILASFPFNNYFHEVKDLLVFNGKLYFLSENQFSVFDFTQNLLFKSEVYLPVKLRRENDLIYIISKNKIQVFLANQNFETVFDSPNAQIVDKNSSAYFVIRDNKVYLYKLE